MHQYLVIVSFVLAYLISHAEEPLPAGGMHADKSYTARNTESYDFFAEKPDTEFTWYSAIADIAGKDLVVTDAPETVAPEQKRIRVRQVQILHLDLPPPAKG